METESRNIELHSAEEIPCLPEEVIMKEILPRLPVKSLLRFRCVAKSWCSLIGSKSFIKAHLQNSIRITRFDLNWVFYDDHKKEIKQCSLPSLSDKPFTNPITCKTDLGIDLNPNRVFISGCCNGLVCILEDYNSFILWNPTTKKFKYLPSLYTLIQDIQEECGPIVKDGFGFDELDDDYKVFGMVKQYGADDEPIRCIGMIYSLGTNSWKVIEEMDVSPFDDDYEGLSVYVSGKLHWCRREGYKRDIVSFDLNSHVYEVVELPSYINGFLDSLEVVGGCLSMQCHHQNGDTDVWLMKEYGVKESWDKVATVNNRPDTYEIPTALAIGPNGEVLLNYYSSFVIYDPNSNVFRYPQVIGIHDDIIIDSLAMYIESLASVDPDTQQER